MADAAAHLLLGRLSFLRPQIMAVAPISTDDLFVLVASTFFEYRSFELRTFKQVLLLASQIRPQSVVLRDDRLVWLADDSPIDRPPASSETAQQNDQAATHRRLNEAQLAQHDQRDDVFLCPFRTQALCEVADCQLVHFTEIIRPHTDPSLGDCSYLDTCHRPQTCRFLHYDDPVGPARPSASAQDVATDDVLPAVPPPAYCNADLRHFDLASLGSDWSLIVADPPWDIHMDLPYATMSDGELLNLRVDLLQPRGGVLALWVTNRTMELGRMCLRTWGYTLLDEIVWCKVNQLHRPIRSGRTGHWLNHSKEHVLVAVRGTLDDLPSEVRARARAKLDSNVIVAEVRETSRKPVELYEMLERLVDGWVSGDASLRQTPGFADEVRRTPDHKLQVSKKLELFGRYHNLRDGWLTVGDQVGRQ